MTKIYEIGPLQLDAEACVLTQAGTPVALGARGVAVLFALVSRANEFVPKAAILDAAWPGLVVVEGNLAAQISLIRRALALVPGAAGWIETLARRGYRFVGPVTELTARASPASPTRERTNLPRGLQSFIGRERELAEIKQLLPSTQLLTLTGTGGIGKTRLALQVAAEVREAYRDGVWFVDLAPLTDSASVPSALARVLGVKESSGQSLTESLIDQLRTREILLILDNCEHVLTNCAHLAETFLREAPGLTLLATSRERLRIDAERAYLVNALPLPASNANRPSIARSDAVQLFVERARQHRPGFDLEAKRAQAVAEICVQLDGIPLALELAAARIAVLPVEQIARLLSQRFRLLISGSRSELPRHQTLSAMLDWSYGLLDEAEKQLFIRLSVFKGGWTLALADDVCAGGPIRKDEVVHLLISLIEKSLVVADEDGDRYRMLETVRVYALARLGEAGDSERMLRKHAEAMLALLAAHELDDLRWRITPADTVALAAELDNLRAAIAWVTTNAAGADLVVPLAGVSYHVWMATSHHAEGLERLLALRQHVHDGVPPRDAAVYWLALAVVGKDSSEPRESFEAALRAVDLYRSLGDDSRCYDALVYAAVLGTSTRERELAIADAARLQRVSWPVRQRAGLAYARCWLYARLGRYEEALACAQQQAAINRDGGNLIGEQAAMNSVTAIELLLGRPEAALEHGRAAIARLNALGRAADTSFLYWTVMIALILLNRLREAVDAARIAYALLLREGNECLLLAALALLAALQGHPDVAARIIGHDDAVLARTGQGVRPLAALLRGRLDAVLANALPAREVARLRVEGAGLRKQQVFDMAFGDGA